MIVVSEVLMNAELIDAVAVYLIFPPKDRLTIPTTTEQYLTNVDAQEANHCIEFR